MIEYLSGFMLPGREKVLKMCIRDSSESRADAVEGADMGSTGYRRISVFARFVRESSSESGIFSPGT